MINNILIQLASWTMQKALIASVIAGALYYFMLYDDGSSIQTQLNQVQSEIQTQEAKSAEADAALKKVEQLRVAGDALSDQFKLVSAAIPTDVQMSDIIRAVDTVARASAVSIKSKEPNAVINRDFYEEIPLSISLQGKFSQINMFLYYLTSMQRIMKVKEFTISRVNSGNNNTPLDNTMLDFSGQIISYRFIGKAQEPAVKK